MKQKTKHNNLDINSDYSDSESECEASSLMLGQPFLPFLPHKAATSKTVDH